MEKNSFVCFICCKEFRGGCDGEDLEGNEENGQSLKQFCEVILELDKNDLEGNKHLLSYFHGNSKDVNGKGDVGGRDTSKENVRSKFGEDLEDDNVNELHGKLSEFLKNPNDNLSICRDCFDLIKMVMEARLSVKCVEESVEKLQKLLLRELMRLKGRLELFWREFEKMEKKLVSGDLKLIENNLDGSYYQSNEARKKKRRLTSKISQQYVERKQEIFGFRGKISQVFRDFHQFNKKLSARMSCNPISQPTNSKTATSSKKMVNAQRSFETESKCVPKPADKQHLKDSNNGLSTPLSLPAKLDGIGHTHDSDEEDNDVNMDDEPMHLDIFDDNDDFSEDNQVETEPIDKRSSLRRRAARKKYDLEPSDSDEQDSREDYSEDYQPEDPEKLSRRANIYRLLREYKPHLAQMSPFKRNVITSVIKCLKCQHFNETREKRKGADKLNVFQRHMIHLSYNLESQLISLKDIPIKIVCQAETENEENGLLCTKCDVKIADCPKMETLMWEHVLSKHLDAYQCPHCQNNKQYENQSKYSLHVYKCLRRKEQLDKVECDVCGKSFNENRALQTHKWSHMNEEERKEALESGLVKKNRINKSTKYMEKKFQCEICGNGFAQKHIHQSYEKIHQERDSREQFICPKCGKSFLKTGYEYHLKYGGSCWEDDPNRKKETCGKCGKVLKNKIVLKRHLKDMHAEADLKPWVCEISGKAFKKKMTLKLHEKMHTGEKPWNCRKCGHAFRRQDNMKRHEITCAR